MTNYRNYFRHWPVVSGLVFLAGRLLALDAEQVLNYSWGSLTVKPQLDLTAQFTDNVFYGNNQIYRTNVYQLATNVITVGGTNYILAPDTTVKGIVTKDISVSRSQASDFLFITSPGARLSYGYADANQLSFEYGLDKILYLENPEYNTDQHSITFKAKVSTGHLDLKGTDQMQFLSSFLSGGGIIANGQQVNQQINRRLWTDDYILNYEISPKTFAYFQGYHTDTDYIKGINVYDTATIRGTMGGGYNFSSLVSIFSEVHYGQSSIRPNLAGQINGPHSDFYGGFLGIRGDFTARLSGMVKVGYETRDFPGTTISGSGSPAVEASMTYVPGLKTQLKLDYSRRSEISPQFGRQFYTFDTVGLTVLQSIGTSGKWFVQMRGNLNINDYSDLVGQIPILATDVSGNYVFSGFIPGTYIQPANTINQQVNVGRTDTQYSFSATLVYQPRTWLQFSLGYQFDHYSPAFRDAVYESTHPLIAYNANQFTLRAVIGF